MIDDNQALMRQTQSNDPSPIKYAPVAEKACDRSSADAYDSLTGIVFSATTMLLFGDNSFGSVC